MQHNISSSLIQIIPIHCECTVIVCIVITLYIIQMKMILSYKRDNAVSRIRNMSGDNRLGIDAEGHRLSGL